MLTPDSEGTFDGADGRRVAYLERGPVEGRVVMYLHGMPGSRHEQRVIPDAVLERFGVRLVSVDRPGYGGTDPLAGDRVARSRDVLAVADRLGVDRFPVMAVSAGGSYALALAASAPDRVDRLVLAGAQMPYDDESAITTLLPDQLGLLPFLRNGRNELVEAGAEDFRARIRANPWTLFEPAWASLSASERDFLDQPTVRAILERDMVAGVERSAEGLIDDLVLWPEAIEIEVRNLRCPVVAVHGDLDDWEPLTNLLRILEGMPFAEVIVLHGRNHLGPLMRPTTLVGLTAAEPTPRDP